MAVGLGLGESIGDNKKGCFEEKSLMTYMQPYSIFCSPFIAHALKIVQGEPNLEAYESEISCEP
jgi:hypothetical protein